MTIQQALVKVGEELKSTMIQTLKDNKSYNSGQLANSIMYDVRTREFNYELVRTMLTYGIFVDQGIGRGPGKRPPWDPKTKSFKTIVDWIQAKKIPVPTKLTVEQFAFAIANKIKKRGTDPKPRPFITPSIQQVMRTTGKELLQEAGVDTVVANINGTLEDINVRQ
jgi:hypothetical protein